MKRLVLFTLICATVVLVCGQDAIALREFEPGITLVDTDELKGMVDKKFDMLLVNTLAPILFRDSAIAGSINLPFENLVRGKVQFPADKGKMMVYYCLGFQ